MHIRPATTNDYPAIVALQNANLPHMPAVVADYEHSDKQTNRDERSFLRRWMVEVDGQVVGMAQHRRETWNYDPHKYFITVYVMPSHHRQGIGTRLYEHMLAELEPHSPQEFMTRVWEAHAGGVGFAEKYGFRETLRDQQSQLDLASFDPQAHADALTKLAEHNIEVKTVAELLADDPDCVQKMYAMETELFADIPSDEPFVMAEFDKWFHEDFDEEMHYKDMWYVALHNGEYVGESGVWGDRASNTLYTAVTGVRRAYRRKGIARALKVMVLTLAQERGYDAIKTDNEENNQGMLAINYALGFVPQPAWLTYRKFMTE